MELQQLRYFVHVANYRNFTKAARRCNVAQPSLSQQIKKLETELKSPLFHRQGRNIVLTESGQVLLPRALSILSLHDNTVSELNELAGHCGTVRFGIIQTMAPYVVPYLLDLHREKQAMELPAFEVYEDFTENLIKKLVEGELDFAVMSSPISEPQLMMKVIAHEPFVAVVPSDSKLVRLGTLKLSDLRDGPFLPLSRIHCAGQQIHELCKLGTDKTRTIIQSFQIETILRLVASGGYATVVPLMAMSGEHREGVTQIPLSDKKIQRQITIVQHPDRYQSESARKLMKSLSNAIENLVKKHQMRV